MCIKKRGAKQAVNDRAMRAEAPAPEAAASNADGSDTHLADNSEMFVTAKRRAYSRTLPKPADNPEESTDVDMASITLPSVLATGNMPIDQRSMRSADSFALAAHPTGSHALAPGPYHRANARLRQLLPHYQSNTTVSTSWAHVVLTALAVLCTLGYFGIRLWYLISGRTAAFAEGAPNTSVWYSWVILVAEVGLVFLAFFGHQLYFKQHTTFRVMDERATSALIQVRTHSAQHMAFAAMQAMPRGACNSAQLRGAATGWPLAAFDRVRVMLAGGERQGRDADGARVRDDVRRGGGDGA